MIAALVLAGASLALAQPDVDQARVRFETGSQAYERGNYALALENFLASYQLMTGDDRQGILAYNIGVTRERLNQPEQALESLREFMRRSPPTTPERAAAQDIINELEARLRVNAAVAPESISPIGPIVMAGGGAVLIAGIIAGSVALAQGDALRGRCGGSVCPSGEAGAANDLAIVSGVADALIFAGAAAVVTGFILTLLLRERSAPPAVAMSCSTTECRLSWTGVFQ
jgi:hypothetical protein